MSMKSINDATLLGIKVAQEKFVEWSGGWWLGYAPEYLLTCSIAEAISNAEGSCFVTLEHSVTEMMYEAGTNRRGPWPKKLRGNGRADIVVWWACDEPRAIIEVKTDVYSLNKLRADIDRIANTLSKNGEGGSIQFGTLALFTDASDSEKSKSREILELRINGWYEKIKIKYEKKLNIERDFHIETDGNDSWAGVNFSFRTKV